MTLGHRAGVGAAALVLATGALGCSDDRVAGEEGGSATSDETRDVPGQQPPAVAGPNDEDAELPTPGAYPTWDARARAYALRVAETAMRAFARPEIGEATWWAELSPLLSPAASSAYQGTDPAEVPARTVTGEPTLVDESSTYLAPVSVPTDVGVYLVLLSRADQGSPWLVERITPPENDSSS